MLSDEIRARLAQLHTFVRPSQQPSAAALCEADRMHGPSRHGSQGCDSALPSTNFAIDHGVEIANASGKHLLFRRPLGSLWSDARGYGRPWSEAQAPSFQHQAHPELAAACRHFPTGTLFLDLETCGFAGSPVFLAGLVWQSQGELMLDQLFARDYSEEQALLESLWQIAARNDVLVTFNGKSFDWPMVHDRSTRHRLGRDERRRATARPIEIAESLGPRDARPELVHCDLLHHARRRYKGLLPDCRLQTLERYVCRRWRRDDLGGAEVPAAYHHYVRSGDARQIASILQHNALDLLTLVQLLVRIGLPAPAAASSA